MKPTKTERAFDIIEYLAARPEGERLSTVAADLGLPLSSAHDIMQRLMECDILRADADLNYTVGRRVHALALNVSRGNGLQAVVRPLLEELLRMVGDDIYLATRIERDVTYVEHLKSTHTVNVDVPLGIPLYLHSTAVGKLFMAFDEDLEQWIAERRTLRRLTPHTITDRKRLAAEMKQIRSRKYSVSSEESVEGIIGLAVPIFSPEGRIIYALHVSAPTTRMRTERVSKVLEMMGKISAKAFSSLWPDTTVDDASFRPGGAL